MDNTDLMFAANSNTLSKPLVAVHQSCAVPFRTNVDQIEFCLITSKKKGQWIFPKGVIEPGDTPVQTALKEAFEEAGLFGCVIGAPLGEYQYTKKRKVHAVTVFMMEVARCEEAWQESNQRVRRWVRPSTARQLLAKTELSSFLDAAVSRKLPGIEPASR